MMDERSDAELLDLFARRQDHAAFREIVTRHASLVYAAALRQVGPELAEDVSQAVFFILSRKARRVDGRTLAGWLVIATRLTAKASQRIELRCKAREQKAAVMKNETIEDPSEVTAQPGAELAPLLDEALMRLSERDRNAVTLRYLQGKSVRQVAAAMQISEAAAGKRATRAVKTLREYFARRGVNVSGEFLSSALAVQGAVTLPVDLAAKLSATASGAAATTLSTTAAALVQGTLPMMATAKANLAAGIGIAVLVLGGSAVVAAQLGLFQQRTSQPPSTPAPREARAPTPPTAPPSGRESLTRYPTPPDSPATFDGRVEGLDDPATAEVGLIYLRGTHWTSANNYQWQPLNPDGTFTIRAEKFPDADRGLAVRAPGQSVTFLRAEFDKTESAKDIVLRMQPVLPLTITARNSKGALLSWFKVEIFEASVAGGAFRTDDNGRRLHSQRIDAPSAKRGAINTVVPAEPVALLISGDGIAPNLQTIDPRKTDQYEFHVMAATPIDGNVTDGGVPVAGEKVMLNNDAVALSYTARTTDAAGHFQVPAGIPGTYNIVVRGKRTVVQLVEGQPLHVDVELRNAAAPTVAAPVSDPATRPAS